MKPDYKNWMPKGMVYGTAASAAGCLGLAALCKGTKRIKSERVKNAAAATLLLGGAAAGGAALWMEGLYRAFSYDGKRQMSRQIIEGIAVITGHTGWTDDLDFAFAHRTEICKPFTRRYTDPEAPYDGYEEGDDTEAMARSVPLSKKKPSGGAVR